MSTFKTNTKKNAKKGRKSYKNSTLDMKHSNKVDYFNHREDNLPKYKNKLNKYVKELDKLEYKAPTDYDVKDIKRKSFLKSEIAELKETIYNIENSVDEMDYYAETMDILVDYFDVVDNDTTVKQSKSIDIMDFFKAKGKCKNEPPKKDRATLYDNYLQLVDNTYIKKKYKPRVKLCSSCGIEKTLHQSDGFFICTNCGETEPVLIDSDKPNYKDPIPDTGIYAYKRINHFELIREVVTAGSPNCAASY